MENCFLKIEIFLLIIFHNIYLIGANVLAPKPPKIFNFEQAVEHARLQEMKVNDEQNLKILSTWYDNNNIEQLSKSDSILLAQCLRIICEKGITSTDYQEYIKKLNDTNELSFEWKYSLADAQKLSTQYTISLIFFYNYLIKNRLIRRKLKEIKT